MQNKEEIDLSLVIACYNEESVLEGNFPQIIELLNSTIYSYEIIFVDDCSKDRTREIIDEIINQYKEIQIKKIFHSSNRGRGKTVTDGFLVSQGNVIGYIDIDLEIHARYIPSMVNAINNGYDVATAFRIYKLDPTFFILFRHILSHGYRLLSRFILGHKLKDTEAGFKFFSRAKILPILEKIENEGWFWDTEIMVLSFYHGLNIVEIPCLFIRNLKKKSTVSPIKDSISYLISLLKFRRKMKAKGAFTNYESFIS